LNATTAAAVLRQLFKGSPESGIGRVTWLASDGASRFARVGSTFLGEPSRADAVEIIDL